MSRRVVAIAVTLLLIVASVAVAADPDPSLAAWWKLDGDLMDASGNAHHGGTFTGDAHFEAGMYGQALALDGTGDYVTIDGYTGVTGKQSRTIAAWIQTTGLGSIVAWGDDVTGQKWSFRVQNSNGTAGAIRVEVSGGYQVGSTDVRDGDWHHVVAVLVDDGSPNVNEIQLYVDGVRETNSASKGTAINTASTQSVWIGFDHQSRPFPGLMDEVRIYDRALTAAEIAAMALRPKAYHPDPADGGEVGTSIFAFSWKPRQGSLWHDVYLGTSPELGPQDLVQPQGFATLYVPPAGSLIPGTMYYWRIDEIDPDKTVHPGDVWSFFYYPLEAWQPAPGDGAPYMDPNLTLTWKPGLDAVYHDVYFGTEETEVAEGTGDTLKSSNRTELTFVTGALEKATTYYWRVDEADATGQKVKGDVWSFTTLEEMSVIDPNLVAWWTFDEGAYRRAVDWSGHGHHGDFVGNPQWVEGYDRTALWFNGVAGERVEMFGYDGVLGKQDRTVTAWIKTSTLGEIVSWGQNVDTQKWTFRVQDNNGTVGAIRTEVQGGRIVGSTDLRDDEWHHVATVLQSAGAPTILDVRLYVDGWQEAISDSLLVDVNTVGGRNVWIGDSHSSRPFLGVIDDVRIYDKALTQEEIRGVMVRFDPLCAWQPHPAHRSIEDIRTAAPLTWKPGDGAVQHDVYLGADAAAVAAADSSDTTGVYRGRISAISFAPSPVLLWDQKYFWRVDEVAADGSIVTGAVWEFTVPDYLIIDDFEEYTNDAESMSRIFQTWVDGQGFENPIVVPGNGSNGLVGHDIWTDTSPYYSGLIAEVGNVNSGRQAMPLYYDNTYSPYYSEAVRTWPQTRDWTAYDVNTLVVYFRGEPVDYMETASGGILMSASGWDLETDATLTRFDEGRFVYKRLTGDGSVIVRVDSIENTHAWAKGGVMIRQGLDWASPQAAVYVTPGQGVSFQRRLSANGDTVSTTQGGFVAPHWIKLTRTGDLFTAQHSDDGVTWSDVVHATNPTSDTIFMTGTVYIGLVLTSHVEHVACAAEFSGVQISPNVTGSWEMAEIGVDHLGNSPDSLYLAITDNNGKTATVSHPDPMAAVSVYGTYAPWTVDLAQVSAAGVNLRAIKKMAIGLGDKNASLPNGAGRLFIDDIRLTRGVPIEPNVVTP